MSMSNNFSYILLKVKPNREITELSENKINTKGKRKKRFLQNLTNKNSKISLQCSITLK
jgi:hypothetical protein